MSQQLLLHYATMFVSDSYRRIDPYYLCDGHISQNRPIIPPDISDYESDGEHLVVHYDEVFEDIQGRLFRVIDFAGRGSYSLVYKCELINTPGRFVAVKISKNAPRLQQRLEKEAQIIQKFGSLAAAAAAAEESSGRKLIPEYVSFFPISGHSCLATGLYQRTLLERLRFENDMSGLILFIRCVMRQILSGLELIHKNGYVHGDLKPDNIMLVRDDSYDIKFIDFGSATTIENDMIRIPQSLCYRSPEMMIGSAWNEKIDIWSAGCIAAEICLDYPLFASGSEEDIIGIITHFISPIPQSMIVSAQYWKQFFAPTPRGFLLLRDPIKCVSIGHLYSEKFEGFDNFNFNLESLIRNRFQTDVEKNVVDSFVSFVHGLLSVDPNERWSAKEALKHGFLSEDFSEETVNWVHRAPYMACSSNIVMPSQFPNFHDDNSLIIHSIPPNFC